MNKRQEILKKIESGKFHTVYNIKLYIAEDDADEENNALLKDYVEIFESLFEDPICIYSQDRKTDFRTTPLALSYPQRSNTTLSSAILVGSLKKEKDIYSILRKCNSCDCVCYISDYEESDHMYQDGDEKKPLKMVSLDIYDVNNM